MTLYDQITDLPLEITDYDLEPIGREQLGGRTRTTTIISLHSGDTTGRGEDVTYEAADHHALADADAEAEADGALFELADEYTFGDFSAHLDDLDFFPTRESEREAFHHYRRWAFESAALDLALKQAGTNLAEALDREYDPVRFVISSQLRGSETPTTDRVTAWLDVHPKTELKVDVTAEWTPALVEDLVATDTVRILDLKGRYEGTPVDQPADPELYERVIEAFPEAIIEDPALTDETEAVLDGERERISWDAPITGVESIEALPFEPRWLNIKPSRFGTVESLLETIEYCLTNDIRMYGGGQGENAVGREHLHALASAFYPETPNDTAPSGYNDPEIDEELPPSPLSPPSDPRGLEWH